MMAQEAIMAVSKIIEAHWDIALWEEDNFPDEASASDCPVHYTIKNIEDTVNQDHDFVIIEPHDEHGNVHVLDEDAANGIDCNDVKGEPFHFIKGLKKGHWIHDDFSGMM
jgi:hypothetical protein